jgi:hypothetical protein
MTPDEKIKRLEDFIMYLERDGYLADWWPGQMIEAADAFIDDKRSDNLGNYWNKIDQLPKTRKKVFDLLYQTIPNNTHANNLGGHE